MRYSFDQRRTVKRKLFLTLYGGPESSSEPAQPRRFFSVMADCRERFPLEVPAMPVPLDQLVFYPGPHTLTNPEPFACIRDLVADAVMKGNISIRRLVRFSVYDCIVIQVGSPNSWLKGTQSPLGRYLNISNVGVADGVEFKQYDTTGTGLSPPGTFWVQELKCQTGPLERATGWDRRVYPWGGQHSPVAQSKVDRVRGLYAAVLQPTGTITKSSSLWVPLQPAFNASGGSKQGRFPSTPPVSAIPDLEGVRGVNRRRDEIFRSLMK